MGCCKCCCENKTPPGECCNNACCESPRVCCGESEPRTCCAEGEICCNGVCQDPEEPCCDPPCDPGQYCCNGVCQDPEEPCCEGECDDSTDCSPGCVCVNGECVTPPPCAPCIECGWPDDRFEFGEEFIECGNQLIGPPSRGQNIYNRLGPLPEGVTWKDGFPGPFLHCNWALVVDSLTIQCCYDNCTVNGMPGTLLIAVKARYRCRVLLINCPADGQPASVSDITDRALQGNLEPELRPGEQFCIGDPVACTQWFEYYDSPTPVCNPLP